MTRRLRGRITGRGRITRRGSASPLPGRDSRTGLITSPVGDSSGVTPVSGRALAGSTGI